MELEGLIKGLNKTRFPFNILGIILFGSYVKNRIKPSSDIDFLIMAEGINLKLHRRFKEIVLIKEALPALPFDILLFTKDGGKWGENGDSALFFLLKIGRCPHFPPMIKVIY